MEVIFLKACDCKEMLRISSNTRDWSNWWKRKWK